MRSSNQFEKKELKRRSKNLSDWYTDVVLKAELADYGPVRGTMVIRPYGYAMWERTQEVFNKMMKTKGVENAYFPLLIPYSFLQREKKHIEGFSPELALVTIGGGKKLKEPLVVRPTSETVMYGMYSKWISSWRDLPILINQWNNIVRWEKRTYLFLRTLEFLWQEGHTAHETEKEAIEMQETALEWYRQIYEDYLALPVIVGEKSNTEKFAGAKSTYSVEPLMPDGKALQAATSHNLGQNFSKVFDINFQDKNGKTNYVWQTSWGLSTRCLGGLFLTHGDDNGLILPPKIAPIGVVIIPIFNNKVGDKRHKYVNSIHDDLVLAGVRVHVDEKEGQSVGRKFNHWEVKGVPLRFEIGEKEVLEEVVTAVRRDTGEKMQIPVKSVRKKTRELLEDIQKNLFSRVSKFMKDNTHEVDNYNDFRKVMKRKKGFIKVYWKEDSKVEMKIKEETKATSRVKLFGKNKKGKCFYSGEETDQIWYFAQAY